MFLYFFNVGTMKSFLILKLTIPINNILIENGRCNFNP